MRLGGSIAVAAASRPPPKIVIPAKAGTHGAVAFDAAMPTGTA